MNERWMFLACVWAGSMRTRQRKDVEGKFAAVAPKIKLRYDQTGVSRHGGYVLGDRMLLVVDASRPDLSRRHRK